MDSFAPHLLANMVGVSVAELAVLPLCTLKAVYQAHPHLRSYRDVWYHMQLHNKGMFRAWLPALASTALGSGIKYSGYKYLCGKKETVPLSERMAYGFLSGMVGTTLVHPLDVWRNQKQLMWTASLKGLKVYYRGYGAAAAKTALLYSCLFPLHDTYKHALGAEWLAAPLTSLTTCSFMMPIDYAKTRLMAGLSVLDKSLRLTQVYRGAGLAMVKNVVHFSIQMWVTESIVKNCIH